jgi:phosphate starvation-inducible PhoH-like protein
MHVLKDVRGIAFTQFSSADVVRHPLVARIVDAYENANVSQEIAALPKPVAVKNARKKS